MKVMLTNRNQITIPKALCNKLHLDIGNFYDLEIRNDEIVIKIDKSYKETKNSFQIVINDLFNNFPENVDSKEEIKDPNNFSLNINGIKIESNLKEGQNYKNKIYSECGLVIRTKKSYMTKFCETCKGQLAAAYNIIDKCPYCKSENTSTSTKIIDKIIENKAKLDKCLDNVINKSKEYL